MNAEVRGKKPGIARKINLSKMKLNHSTTLFPGEALGLTGIGWVLVLFAVLALQDFHPISRDYLPLADFGSWSPLLFFFLPGMVFLILGLRNLPEKGSAPELGPWTGRIWLLGILSAGSYLRLYHLDTPLSAFWDDWGNNLVAIRPILDDQKYYWMFPEDGREPFFSYFLAGVRTILSEWPGWQVLRITTWMLDMGALSLLYLAGKELGSKRAGLVAAGLGALGMPMLQLSLTGMRAFSLSFDTALLLFTTIRLFNKPSFSRFIQWGMALAFGVHTYRVFRSLALAVPLLILPWVLASPNERRAHPRIWVWALLSEFLLLGVFSGTISETHPYLKILGNAWEALVGKGWAIPAIVLAWTILAALSIRGLRRKPEGIRLAGWSLSIGLAAMLIYPLSRGFGFDEDLSILSAFHMDPKSQNTFSFIASKIGMTITSLIYFCRDRPDLQIFWAPFYDICSQGLVALGLAYFLAKPDWKKTFLLAMGGLGTVVYILTIDPASTKLLCSAPPLFLLSGLAVSKVWDKLPRRSRKGALSPVPLLLTAFLVLYAFWGGWIQREKLFGGWNAKRWPDTTLAREVKKDSPLYRVYLAPSPWFFGDNTQFVLNRGKKYYFLKEHNAVPWNSLHPPQDIVMLLDGGQVPGGNTKMIETIREQFKNAEWTKLPLDPRYPLDNPWPVYIWKVVLKASDLSSDPQALLYLVSDKDSCLRRFYSTDYNWGTGAILKEELVSSLSDFVPVDRLNFQIFSQHQYDPRLVQFLKSFEAEEGNTEWTILSSDPVWVKIDGKTLWRSNHRGGNKAVIREIRLKEGPHQIEVLTRCGTDYQQPQVRWKPSGAQSWNEL